MSGLTIYVQWKTAFARDGELYYFPEKFTRYFKEKYSIPSVYRWRIMRSEGETKEFIYIGEAEDLVQRIQRVRTPSRKARDGDTNKRLNKIFHEHLSAGRKIVLDIADIEPFEINGIRFGRDTIDDRFQRRAIENILLAMAQASNEFELLNIVVDRVEKARRTLAKLPPHVVREVFRRYGLDKSKSS